ncbi:hypothetical protein [Stutzerimonas stutzeri]|nr:hypothetical protein [Stutzerimonas stutzeri]
MNGMETTIVAPKRDGKYGAIDRHHRASRVFGEIPATVTNGRLSA